MKKTLYISTLCVITLFFGASPIGVDNQVIASESQPVIHRATEDRLSQELQDLRVNNNVTLKYIHFKAKYHNFINYYSQIDKQDEAIP